MSAIAPSTNIKLLKLPIELDNENQLTFANATAQFNYFNSLTKLPVEKFTYQRKDGVIRFPANVDDVIQYNYVMYQNTAFSNKWFYAYVDKMKFVNPNTTDVYIRTDPFQTWQFDITFQESFIEREHVNDDTPGLHTIPENLEIGETVVDSATSVLDVFNATDHGGSSSDAVCTVIGVTEIPGTISGASSTHIRKYNSVFQGLTFFAFLDASKIQDFITMYTRAGKSEAIYCMYMCPRILIPLTSFANAYTIQYTYQGTTYTVQNVYFVEESNGGYANTNISTAMKYVHPSYTVVSTEPNEVRKYNLAGYEFRNNKLLTYPFSYVNITNNAGNSQIYKWEDFKLTRNASTNQAYPAARFNTYAALSASPSTKIVPMDYKNRFGSGVNYVPSYEYGMSGQKLPACSWTSDYYTNWLTQNAANIEAGWKKTLVNGATNTASSTILGSRSMDKDAGVGTMTMAASSMIQSMGNMATYIEDVQASVKTAVIHPDELSGDANSGEINYATGNSGFTILVMAIKPEYAAVVDGYFDKFGYKVNITKVPNITGRANWNYVKTIRGKIHGYIPKEDLNTISEMIDNGVTFWHNASTFLDYTQSNNIIS